MKSISAIVIAAFMAVVFVIARIVIAIHVWLYVAAILMSGAWGAYKVTWIIRMGPAARQYIPMAIWAKLRWRYLMRHCALGYPDPHKTKSRRPFGMAIGSKVRIETSKAKVTCPKVRIRPDSYGITARVKTVARTGRQEYEDQAQHIADFWKCARVGVTQASPGRLMVRGMKSDPLAVRMSMEDAPTGTYDSFDPHKVYIGRDEWADHRYIDLSGITGMAVTGLQGYGKTSLILSWLCQMAASKAVQFVTIDGKGSADYIPWHGRTWMHTGDSLEDACGVLEDVHSLMRKRLDNIVQLTGFSNGWKMGPQKTSRLQS